MTDNEKIIKDIETRLKTIMIGSISRMEKSFGYLWNYGDEPNTATEEQFADKWEDLREDILNHGNQQIRLAINLLEKHFKKPHYNYNYKFINNHKEDNRR